MFSFVTEHAPSCTTNRSKTTTNLLVRAKFMPFKYKRSHIFGIFMA